MSRGFGRLLGSIGDLRFLAGLQKSKSPLSSSLSQRPLPARSKSVMIIMCRQIKRAHLWTRSRGNDRSRGSDICKTPCLPDRRASDRPRKVGMTSSLMLGKATLSPPIPWTPWQPCFALPAMSLAPHVALGCTRTRVAVGGCTPFARRRDDGSQRPDVRHAQGPSERHVT